MEYRIENHSDSYDCFMVTGTGRTDSMQPLFRVSSLQSSACDVGSLDAPEYVAAGSQIAMNIIGFQKSRPRIVEREKLHN